MKKLTIEQAGDGWLVATAPPDEGEPETQGGNMFPFSTFGATDSSGKSLLGFVQNYFEQNG